MLRRKLKLRLLPCMKSSPGSTAHISFSKYVWARSLVLLINLAFAKKLFIIYSGSDNCSLKKNWSLKNYSRKQVFYSVWSLGRQRCVNLWTNRNGRRQVCDARKIWWSTRSWRSELCTQVGKRQIRSPFPRRHPCDFGLIDYWLVRSLSREPEASRNSGYVQSTLIQARQILNWCQFVFLLHLLHVLPNRFDRLEWY